MRTVSHNGGAWTSLGRGPNGHDIWPIEELFARKKFKPTVQERIRRLNPDGKEEGVMCRGWWIKPMSWRRAKRRIERGGRAYWFRRKGNKGVWSWASMGPAPECR